MPLKRDRILFGIHSITPFSRADSKPYGILKVIGGGNLEATGESEDLYGGSSRFPYASEPTQIQSSMTAQVKSYPNFLMELFLGGAASTAVASTGEVRDYGNVKGTSINAATGISSVEVVAGDLADLKFGRYVIEAASANTVNVYALTDIDFGRGTKGAYLDDSLMIASGLSIVSTEEELLADYGIKLVGGASVTALVVGDTAVFDVFPAHDGISFVDVGSATASFSAFGAAMLASKNSQKEIFQIMAYNCVGTGMPIPLQEKAYAISDLTIKLLRDESKDAVFRVTAIGEV